MNNKHTPGPWTISDNTNGEPRIYAPSGYCVALAVMPNNTNALDIRESAQANARLIAAAPDLIAALAGALYQMEQMSNSETKENDIDLWQAQLDAIEAIAKATGRGAQS